MFQVLNSKQQLILHAICHVVVALLLARFYYEYAGVDERGKKVSDAHSLIHNTTHTQGEVQPARSQPGGGDNRCG